MSPHNKSKHTLVRSSSIFVCSCRNLILSFGIIWIIAFIHTPQALCDSQEVGQDLSVLILPGGKVSVPAVLSLINTGTVFNPFTGTLPVSYRIRNSSSGSNITITIAATTNFAPSGGPSISNGDLSYTCSAATLGTSCSGTQTLSTITATTVLSVASSACGSGCSSSTTNTSNLNFSLSDDPRYQTGTYSTSVVLTMSSL